VIATFYSYKGGVGRSMAMANVADLLARNGLRTLIIDFDLEAPGLEQYFQTNQAAARRNPGLLDLLLAYEQSMSVAGGEGEDGFRNLDRFIVPIYQTLPGGGRLDLLPAGQRATTDQIERYASRLRTFDWQDFYVNWEGELFFEWLRTTLVPVRYDLVLVDSRTGVTEMGGICTYQLADVIVMLCGANIQNQQGTSQVAADFLSSPVQAVRRHRPLTLMVVPARVEQRDPELLKAFLVEFERTFASQLPLALRRASLGFEELTIPYEPQYAFNEVVLSDPARVGQRRTIAGAFERIARALTLLAPADSPVSRKIGRATAAAAPPPASSAAAAPAPASPSPPPLTAVPVQYDAAKRFADFDVYLAYAAEDAKPVDELSGELQKRGLRVFMDRQTLSVGDDWRARTEQALFHSRAVFLCLRSGGDQSAWDPHLRAIIDSVRPLRELIEVPVVLPGAGRLVNVGERPVLDLSRGLQTPDARAALDQIVARIRPAPPAPSAAVAPTVSTGAPYVGLDAFDEKDAGCLFGRDAEIHDVAAAIQESSCVVITGPSGCGKTSLVMAGVLPHLRQCAPQGKGWISAHASPRRVAVDDLLRPMLKSLVDLSASTPDVQRLAFVDQLEEVLLLRAEERKMFMATLAETITQPATTTRFLLAVREDRLDELALPSDWNPVVISIRSLSPEAMRLAIERPAERVGLAFEPGLVDRLLTDWGRTPGCLPFLQLMLLRLWERRRDGFLTNQAYDQICTIEGDAKAAFAALPTRVQTLGSRLLPRIIVLCRNLSASCARRDLTLSNMTDDEADETLDALTTARLLYTFNESDGDARVVPTFRLDQWSLAQEWVTSGKQFFDWLLGLDRYRRDWLRTSRDPGGFLSGKLLKDALQWSSIREDDLTTQENTYIQLSDDYDRFQRNRRRLRIVGAIVITLLAIAATWAVQMYRSYEANTLSARSTALIDQARQAVTGGDLETAASRYAEALTLAPANDTARIRHASVLDQLGKSPEAINEFNKAIGQLQNKAHTSDQDAALLAQAYLGIGIASFHDQKPAMALEYFAKTPSPQTAPTVSFNRGVVYESLGKAQEALDQYSAALRLQPDYVDALFNRGVLYEELRNRDAAIADFKAILALANSSPQTKAAATSRLEALNAGGTIVATRRIVRVFLHIADENDRPLLQMVSATLAENGFKVEGIQQVVQATKGDIRYFYQEDEAQAGYVKQLAEGALNSAGVNIRLTPIFVSSIPKKPEQGTIEVWVPSLRQRLAPLAS
jgi:tetratricopeptide (TPR) repeat protein/energy-coupling factor transporter ATP-binding protein EcfA2